MTYRYYVVTVDDGTVYGTNDEAKAQSYSQSDEAWVIDTKKGVWIINEEDTEIKELP